MTKSRSIFKTIGDNLAVSFMLAATVASVIMLMLILHEEHWDKNVPRQMNQKVYAEIPAARNLGFYHARNITQNTINGPHKQVFISGYVR